jgi:serine/threonine-protein kinase
LATTGPNGRAVITGLPAGEHSLDLRLPDGRVFRQTARVSAGVLASRAQFVIPAERSPVGPAASPSPPASGSSEQTRILVVGNVSGATVDLDGRRVGQTDSKGSLLVTADPGHHVVRVQAPGYEPHEDGVDARRGLANRLDFSLRRAAVTRGPDSVTVTLLVILGVVVAATIGVALYLVRRHPSQTVTTRRIDRYEVRTVLGRGGMATVYSAVDTLDRSRETVALKVMDEGLLRDEDLVRKFLREGEILTMLNRADPEAPLVRVYHYGRANNDHGTPFIAMELLQGQSLLAYLKGKGRLGAGEATQILLGVVRALQPAHAAGVYHRDLSPDNVILTDSARGGHRLRLIDFGVARHEYTSHGTLDGSIAGKPPYMSPEQCQAIPVDGRSDIYALGILLYTLVSGAPPFTSRNPLEVMAQHKDAQVQYSPDFPEAARRVVARALEKNRDKRHRNLKEFQDDLRQVG